ncbi:hypothetical protein [Rheinheimera sp. EpRS3]|uniref:hypothetical protein n=1 Tax=Rheinheimera sp. EpRS3 TaxID=1712383 RepID=UPI000748273C|nr:hypothetical protein [Rheinheimera sp. EpRS3]KUM53477.1 hypothetical protein AR688_06115 [Rheinheimera sp. EpRS3]
MPIQKEIDNQKISDAKDIIGWYTVAATAKGAVPVPATSLAIIANNGFMIAHVSSQLGIITTWDSVLTSLGVAGTLNVAGRAIFIEAAKALSWGTGNAWAAIALSAVGASTAGLQTYIIGLLTIQISKNGGKPITQKEASEVIDGAKKHTKNLNKK